MNASLAETAGGAEFLAGVELLSASALGQQWLEDVAALQRRHFTALLGDLGESGMLLAKGDPLAAAVDHCRRRVAHATTSMVDLQRINTEYWRGLGRLHRSFVDSFLRSQSGKDDR